MDKCTILFQGDSITDGKRGRTDDPNHILGHGYAFIAAAELGFKMADKDYEFINKGESGDTAPDLYARWQSDCLNLTPDVISILVGINDTAQETASPAGTFCNRYKDTLRLILNQTKSILPDSKIILMEPFMLDSGNKDPDEYKKMFENICIKQQEVKSLSDEFGTLFIPLQKAFEDATAKKPAKYWIWDSIHPTYAGHGLIADAWLKRAKDFI